MNSNPQTIVLVQNKCSSFPSGIFAMKDQCKDLGKKPAKVVHTISIGKILKIFIGFIGTE